MNSFKDLTEKDIDLINDYAADIDQELKKIYGELKEKFPDVCFNLSCSIGTRHSGHFCTLANISDYAEYALLQKYSVGSYPFYYLKEGKCLENREVIEKILNNIRSKTIE